MMYISDDDVLNIIMNCIASNAYSTAAVKIKTFLEEQSTNNTGKKLVLTHGALRHIESYVLSRLQAGQEVGSQPLRSSLEMIQLIEYIASHYVTENGEAYKIEQQLSFIREVYCAAIKSYLEEKNQETLGKEHSLERAEIYLEKYFRIANKAPEEARSACLVTYYGGMAKLAAQQRDWLSFEQQVTQANYYYAKAANFLLGKMLQDAYQKSYVYTYQQQDFVRSLRYAKQALKLYRQANGAEAAAKLYDTAGQAVKIGSATVAINPARQQEVNKLMEYLTKYHIPLCKSKLHESRLEKLTQLVLPEGLGLPSNDPKSYRITFALNAPCDHALLAKCLRQWHLRHEIQENNLILTKSYYLDVDKLNKAFKHYQNKLEKKTRLETQRLEQLAQAAEATAKAPEAEALSVNSVVENAASKPPKMQSRKGKEKVSDDEEAAVPAQPQRSQKIKFNRYYTFKPSGAGKNPVYELNEGNINSVDRKFVCVSKKLLAQLDARQQQRLYGLLQRGKQIGQSKGENGFIITKTGADIKGKLCKEDYRFFGKKVNLSREVTDSNGQTCTLYELNALQDKHKNAAK